MTQSVLRCQDTSERFGFARMRRVCMTRQRRNMVVIWCNDQRKEIIQGAIQLSMSNSRPANPEEAFLRLPKQPTELPEDRPKIEKNRFIKKLQVLQSEPHEDMRTLHRSLPSQSGEALSGDRRQRNKLAARQSRDRKKLFVKLMETKIEHLQLELVETAQEIEQLRLQIFNAEMHQGAQGKEAKHKQLHIIKKLEGLLASHLHIERNNEINICLDSIVYRIGALGSQRKAALKKLYSDLLNFSQPALYRYMLWSAVKKINIFGPPLNCEENRWWDEIESVVAQVVDTPGLKEKIDAIRQELVGHCRHFQQSADELVKFRADIEQKGQILDNVFNEVRETLTPEQVAQLILFVERHQFKREVRLFDDEEHLDCLSKKLKLQHNSL